MEAMTARHPSVVVLTGAGISRESGLATFRDPDGIWARVRVEDVATPGAQLRDPAIAPNAAHLALARFEREWPGGFLLVTQNVDDLHARAGSRRLVHMHGELGKARCGHCGHVAPWQEDLSVATACPSCGRAGGMRPHVVWFGEMPLAMDEIGAALDGCDLFMAIGTSGQVHPAAGFVAEVAGRARTVELNLEPGAMSRAFDARIEGPASEPVPAFLATLLRDAG
jgi:NAD-dependent deacetylase